MNVSSRLVMLVEGTQQLSAVLNATLGYAIPVTSE